MDGATGRGGAEGPVAVDAERAAARAPDWLPVVKSDPLVARVPAKSAAAVAVFISCTFARVAIATRGGTWVAVTSVTGRTLVCHSMVH